MKKIFITLGLFAAVTGILQAQNSRRDNSNSTTNNNRTSTSQSSSRNGSSSNSRRDVVTPSKPTNSNNNNTVSRPGNGTTSTQTRPGAGNSSVNNQNTRPGSGNNHSGQNNHNSGYNQNHNNNNHNNNQHNGGYNNSNKRPSANGGLYNHSNRVYYGSRNGYRSDIIIRNTKKNHFGYKLFTPHRYVHYNNRTNFHVSFNVNWVFHTYVPYCQNIPMIPETPLYIQSANNFGRNMRGFWNTYGYENFTFGNILQLDRLSDASDFYFTFVKEGNFYRIVSGDGYDYGMVDSAGDNYCNGSVLEVWEDNYSKGQLYKIIYIGNGRFRIYTATGKVLCSRSNTNPEGSPIQLWDDYYGESTEWYLINPYTGQPIFL